MSGYMGRVGSEGWKYWRGRSDIRNNKYKHNYNRFVTKYNLGTIKNVEQYYTSNMFIFE